MSRSLLSTNAIAFSVSLPIAACGGAAPLPADPGPAPPRSAVSLSAPIAAAPAPADASAPTPVASASNAALAVPESWEPPLKFEQVLKVPVRSLTLGRAPFVAVLSDSAWMRDARGWKELALTGATQKEAGASANVGIFFGRDDRPRLMGSVLDDGRDRPVYWRWKGGWERDRKELGRLAGNPIEGLYGVIGDDDPEVVCKVGDVCIVKRRTGWKTIAPGQGLGRIHLCHGDAWMIDAGGVARLDGDKWARLPPIPEGAGKETGWWADPQGTTVRVSVASLGAIHRYRDGRWEKESCPIAEPGAMWGSSSQDVWVVGKGGVAHFDGQGWRKVKGLEGGFAHVTGRGPEEVWIGGDGGLWEGKGSAGPRP